VALVITCGLNVLLRGCWGFKTEATFLMKQLIRNKLNAFSSHAVR
jgi:hypothetical protein